MADHPDLNLPWCKKLLSDPSVNDLQLQSLDYNEDESMNSMFKKTLYTDSAIRAHLSFRRPCSEPDAIRGQEDCYLISVGHGVDGKTGRAHGGFNALILDQVAGMCVFNKAPNPNPPATATLTVDYKAPISTPCVILARAWLIELSGRKIWVRAVIEDGEGKVLASGKALFVSVRPTKL